MCYRDYRFLVSSDLYRHAARTGVKDFLIQLFLNPGFQYCFWMRTCAYTKQHALLKYGLFPIVRLILNHYIYKYGIDIPYRTRIGSGFYIGHFGSIFVHGNAVIGKNCNISPGVVVGESNRGKYKGYPIIGDNVYLGPGAKIIGCVKVGHRVAVGANCVVTKDVPDDAVIVGIPGKVISLEGSKEYIKKTDYGR